MSSVPAPRSGMLIDDQLEALIESKVAKLSGWNKNRLWLAIALANRLATCVGSRLYGEPEDRFKQALESIHNDARALAKSGASKAQDVIRDSVMEAVAGILRHV